MARNSSIEWTTHTFNPWWGCQRVSPGCEHCYAETWARRYQYQVWGPAKTTGRRELSEDYWKQPLRWNTAALASGERPRVFCGSMCDVFEEHPAVDALRERLWGVIQATPQLDWLLLTKRPENILSMISSAWYRTPPHNVWYGASAEDQKRANDRMTYLAAVPARVRFLSCEPLLGPVDLFQALAAAPITRAGDKVSDWLHWVIAGGESGAGARPMHPAWVRSLRDQCEAAGTKFFFKQWGEYQYGDKRAQREPDGSITFHGDGMPLYVRAGKKAAGRLLDGREWNEVPA